MEITIPELTGNQWLLLIFIAENIWFATIYWKVRKIYKIFTSDDIYQFSDRLLQAFTYSALKVPAYVLNWLGQLTGDAKQEAQKQAANAAATAAENVAAKYVKK